MNTLKLQNSIFKIFIELFIWNKKCRSKLKANWTKWHLKKHVNFAIENTSRPSFDEAQKPIIWQYWHQGADKAPLLIQKCLETVRAFHPECDIRVLSFDNVQEYVKIPQKYYDLLEQKKIPIAIFSDILRLYLLTTYGGTWVDATIYLTDRIPQSIFDSEFFVLQKDPKKDSFGDKMSCYFIHANRDSIWPHLIRNAIEHYWQENDYLIHYFMFEHIVSMLSDATLELADSWNKMEYRTTEELSHLRRNLYKDFSEKEFQNFKEKSFIHKLSYKVLQDCSSGKSFYDKIVTD